MNTNELNENKTTTIVPEQSAEPESTEVPRPQPPMPTEGESIEPHIPDEQLPAQIEAEEKSGFDRKKMMLLGAGLLAAVLFFALTAILSKAPAKKVDAGNQASHQAEQQRTDKAEGSVTPLMDTVRRPETNNNDGQLGPNDIKRMRSPDGQSPSTLQKPAATSKDNSSLAAVPSFADTQQKWEEPRPYAGTAETNSAQPQQQQNALKETSIVFVRTQVQSSAATRALPDRDDEPVLDMPPGSRILAKLEAEISTSDPNTVVAEVEYTYAIGDQIVVPSGARVFGQISNADASGNVSIKFDEIDLLDGRKEQIDAIGRALDMGPVKGKITGKNAGKNLLVRSVSGIGSTLAMVLGTNTSAAFSEDDLIRQRMAENIGTAGDSEIMNMALNTHPVASVPVDTKFYIVFTKHAQAPSTLHKVTTGN